MAWALAYLGTLAFAGFVLWMRRGTDDRTALMEYSARMVAVEAALASPQDPPPPPGYDELRETVSTLAMASGLKPRKSA